MTKVLDLVITKGKTFTYVVRWETDVITYAAISAITQTAPVNITSASHGVPGGWRVAVVSAKGMTQINAAGDPPKDKDYRTATVSSASALQLNSVNASGYKAYTSGGYVQYFTPAALAGFTARMTVKDKVGGTELISLTTANTKIVVDDVLKTITLSVGAVETAALAFSKGVYDLELVSATGVVTALLAGKVNVAAEVTTT